MKTLIAIFFGICFNAFGLQNASPVEDALLISRHTIVSVDERGCTLSVTGYANFEGYGRMQVTMTATASTCEQAAAELEAEIIKRQLSIEK